MEKLDEINKEINEILALDLVHAPKRIRNIHIKRIQFLKLARNLLETNPNPEFYESEKDRLRLLIEKLSKTNPAPGFYPANFSGNRNTYFNKKMGITAMKAQIKALDFIFGTRVKGGKAA